MYTALTVDLIVDICDGSSTIVPLSHQGHSSIFCNHISLVGSRQFSVKIYIYV